MSTAAPSDHPSAGSVAGHLEIVGGASLHGAIRLPGAKNAALPMLVAACLGDEPTVLEQVPLELNDVRVLIDLLQRVGADVQRIDATTVAASSGRWRDADIRDVEAAGTLRHSLLLLGGAAGLGRTLTLPLPGGCRLGARKHDLHVQALRELGHTVHDSPESLAIDAGRTGQEHTVTFRYPTFGGTINVVLAASIGPSRRTLLRGAAQNPEVDAVIALLNSMGARIRRPAPDTLEVHGVDRLHGTQRSVMADRIVAATLIAATVTTRGEVRIEGGSLDVLTAEAATWRGAGVDLGDDGSGIDVSMRGRLRPTTIETRAYPGFHTDVQPLHGAMMCFAEGTSEIRETILDGRFAYGSELRLLGADTEVIDGGFTCVNGAPGQILRVRGGQALHGTTVRAPDIRGAAALVVAALGAQGTTRMSNLYQLERGYHDLPSVLTRLGANVARRDEHAVPA